jgi:two-component system, OmpR family, alkaline phosphatase synthesis response regulator PhoP
MRVLVVDKDVKTAVLIKQSLQNNDLKLQAVSSGSEALKIAAVFLPQLVLLEVDLEDITGIELCSELREKIAQPVIIVFYTQKKEEFIQVVAFDSGADDFIIKDKKPYYLRSKLNAILRRTTKEKTDERISLDSESRMIFKNGKNIYLSKKEFEIFELLYSKPNQIFNRAEILRALWDTNEERTRMLDVHISHLRDKLGETMIKTVKGIGYGFMERSR